MEHSGTPQIHLNQERGTKQQPGRNPSMHSSQDNPTDWPGRQRWNVSCCCFLVQLDAQTRWRPPASGIHAVIGRKWAVGDVLLTACWFCRTLKKRKRKEKRGKRWNSLNGNKSSVGYYRLCFGRGRSADIMPKSFSKVHKKISKKRGAVEALHENSRDAKRLNRANTRDTRVARVQATMSRGRQSYCMDWTVSWIFSGTFWLTADSGPHCLFPGKHSGGF